MTVESTSPYCGDTMAMARLGPLVLVRHRATRDPDDTDWATFLMLCREALREQGALRVFAWAADRPPRSDQRLDFLRDFPAAETRVVVITEDHRLLLFVRALSWFLRSARAYPPGKTDAALEYLQVADIPAFRAAWEAIAPPWLEQQTRC